LVLMLCYSLWVGVGCRADTQRIATRPWRILEGSLASIETQPSTCRSRGVPGHLVTCAPSKTAELLDSRRHDGLSSLPFQVMRYAENPTIKQMWCKCGASPCLVGKVPTELLRQQRQPPPSPVAGRCRWMVLTYTEGAPRLRADRGPMLSPAVRRSPAPAAVGAA
jgi:hypothetical protein